MLESILIFCVVYGIGLLVCVGFVWLVDFVKKGDRDGH